MSQEAGMHAKTQVLSNSEVARQSDYLKSLKIMTGSKIQEGQQAVYCQHSNVLLILAMKKLRWRASSSHKLQAK